MVMTARIRQAPGEFEFFQQILVRNGEVPTGMHRQLQMGRLFHASGVAAERLGSDLVWWQATTDERIIAAEHGPVSVRAATAVPQVFRNGARRVPDRNEDWALGLLAGSAAPMRVHCGNDEAWLEAPLVYAEGGNLVHLARQLQRNGLRFDWHVQADGLHLLGRGARPEPDSGTGQTWRRAGSVDVPEVAEWVLDLGGVDYQPIDRGWWGTAWSGLMAVGVFGGMAVAGALMLGQGRVCCRNKLVGNGAGWVVALALGWSVTVFVMTLAAGVFGGPGKEALWHKPTAQIILFALFLGAVASHCWARVQPRRATAMPVTMPEGASEVGFWRGAATWGGWVLIAIAVGWLGVRSLAQVPFDAPATVTHGYKAVLFERVGMADPWLLLETGREFCRPHYPHGFAVSAWLAVPPGEWRLGAGAQWQVVLPMGAVTLLLARMACSLAGGRTLALILVALWVGSWPIQRLAGTWYAEPLMLLFWCGALGSWWPLLAHVDEWAKDVDRKQWMMRSAWAGGISGAAMIWVKNEALIWWLMATAAFLALWILRGRAWRSAVGLDRAGMFLAVVGAALPGMITALVWWGWRCWHGLPDGDLSVAAFLARDAGERMEILTQTATVVKLWLFGEGLVWPYGAIWWLLAGSLACFGWRHRRDPVARWLLIICLAGLLIPLCIFQLSTIEPIDRHLIAVWRLMLPSSVAALLLVARLWNHSPSNRMYQELRGHARQSLDANPDNLKQRP